ncbi:efflux RND transporter permease subunit [Halomonas sp. McH1-25]|uniref:efflux RND transporter permease subunit n=1 Tax=unclassified Halomonas TaxID=2609666 RepID=UPI001EF60C6D|nr:MULTISPECIES: efflux RND transporter permease subunit [unclassified Halomonas]MCG7598464.1 efflux RND transporter permease subunit [Halomonas sp. McH1-25]MCP1343455.1 efflux RND transporter permease subunit [Halomonas sp. FL8]MCP1361369.1 efflux RND transporter permease subunit [Halomonas sp. BBD45]
MKFTDIFVRRPVLATVVSLLILLMGLRSAMDMELRQYPELESTVITVSTSYPGASSELVQGFVTTPLQQAIAEANGIDFITSESIQGASTIEVHMELNYDANAALAEVQAKVASQRSVLPEAAESPVIESSTGDSTALMYLAFYSQQMPVPQITDYLVRVVQPKLQALPGVAKARIFGQSFALRVWLDPQRMAALNVTPQQVIDVLQNNNYQAGVGKTRSEFVAINLTANTDISDPEQFADMVVRNDDGNLVRLRDVARIDLGAESYDSIAWYKGTPASFMAIEQAPGANPLDVARAVREALPEIRSQLPTGLNVVLPYDASEFIEDSINEVIKTLLEALVIVLVVIFLTLGSFRAALVPAVAVPLSLIGGAFVMLMLGFSLNLLTLLSMVLAIGLVVDDAIIIVENVHRHIEEGESRFEAALNGAREMATPIIAMTTTLVAVYAPIGFMGGLVGSLFTEFAFTLAGAVVVSGVIALTLSPMLSGKVLKPHGNATRFERLVESSFNRLANGYRSALSGILQTVSVPVVFAAIVLASIYFMFVTSQNELAPTEDQGIMFFQGTAPQTATLEYLKRYSNDIQANVEQVEGYNETFMILGGMSADTVFGGFKMLPWSQRDISQMTVLPNLQAALSQVTGLQTAAFPRPSLPGSSGGLPVQFVLATGNSFEELNAAADELLGKAMASGNFAFLRKSIDLDRPVTDIRVDRDRVADLGLTMADVGQALSTMLGGGFVNRFSMDGRSYKVIPQVDQQYRLDASMIDNYYIEADSGEQVPLSSLVSFERNVEPSKRTQFQQLNALILEGVPRPGVALGDALTWLNQAAAETLPAGYSVDYQGASRQLMDQGSALVLTFFLSLIVIYLVLAAQFESWRDPLIILVSVPMSVAGAMVFITLGISTVNIYTQVGLITLIGVVAKNGILIVEFANLLQRERGLDRRNAVIEAAAIRLRPIIMTSVALIVAMVPLLFATGAGAVSRFDIGLTIAAGLGIGTLLTLFVLPAFYILLARDHNATRDVDAVNSSA